MLKLVEVNGEKFVELEGKRLPLYELNGSHYFQDSIPVQLFQRDEESQPRPYDEAQAKKIAASIRKKVLMQPILSRYDWDTGTFLITEGQHRWRAMKDILSEERIPSIVYIDLDKYVALLCGLEANAEDRARALSGGDVARKTHALMLENRILIERERQGAGSTEPVTEADLLERMGHTTKANQKKFLVGKLLEDIRETPSAKIAPYVSDRQSREKPITAKNFMFFLEHLVRTSAIGEGEVNLREEEFANVLKVSDLLAEALFIGGKWNPEATDSLDTIHAVNVCRVHPFIACGYFIAKVIERYGGSDVSVGTCYSPTRDIDWDKAINVIQQLLDDHIWDQDHVKYSRSQEKLRFSLNQAFKEVLR